MCLDYDIDFVEELFRNGIKGIYIPSDKIAGLKSI